MYATKLSHLINNNYIFQTYLVFILRYFFFQLPMSELLFGFFVLQYYWTGVTCTLQSRGNWKYVVNVGAGATFNVRYVVDLLKRIILFRRSFRKPHYSVYLIEAILEQIHIIYHLITKIYKIRKFNLFWDKQLENYYTKHCNKIALDNHHTLALFSFFLVGS